MNIPESVTANFSTVSSYNLICHFIPGVFFVFLLETFAGVDVTPDSPQTLDIVNLLVLYFIAGVFANRVGTFIMMYFSKTFSSSSKKEKNQDPNKKSNWYRDYVIASKKDITIEKLVMMKELYKTLIAVVVLTPAVWLFMKLYTESQSFANINPELIFIFALIFLLVSYKRQSKYIDDRIAVYSDGESQ